MEITDGDELWLQKDTAEKTAMPVKAGINPELFRQKLEEYFNELITTDFSRLVMILYRLDISEKKLKQLLANRPATSAGALITVLVIERQLEKVKMRKKFTQPGDTIPEDEKW